MSSTRASLQGAGVAARRRRAARGPPSRGTCRPSRPRGATGSTTSARSVTALRADLEADHEAGGVERGRARRPGRAGRRGRRRRRRRPPSSPAAAAARIAPVSRPGVDRQVRRRPRRRRRRPGPRRRRPGGRRAAGSAARRPRRAPRSPARRGTQASRAPVASASRSAAVSAPGTVGQPLADEDDGAAAAQQLRRRPRPRRRRRAIARERPRPRCPGAAGEQPAVQLGQPAGGPAARPTTTCWPCLRTRLAQPQEDDRRLLLGLEARRAARPAPPRGRRR